MRYLVIFGFIFFFTTALFSQSGRVALYSESSSEYPDKILVSAQKNQTEKTIDSDVINIETDLVIVPVRISDSKGRTLTDLRKEEFKIFQNGVEQQLAYFSNTDQPLTLALVLDTSYSGVFKIEDIRKAALEFINQLRPEDKVAVISFDEQVKFLCEPTNNRKILHLAVEAAEIASGTSLYTALDQVITERFRSISGRKAVILFTDGVDTTSKTATAEKILDETAAFDAPVFTIQYNTYDDVQKSRKENAEIYFDKDDRPYTIMKPPAKGERVEDYKQAEEFIKELANRSGGRVYRISSRLNLSNTFAAIADELRKVYGLGYYPAEDLKSGQNYSIKVRVYRPGLTIRTKSRYIKR